MSISNSLLCKTNVTIAHGNDLDFLEIMIEALLISGSAASPVASKKWSSTGLESILTYVALIILHDDISRQQTSEQIGLSIMNDIEGTLSGKESPLVTQNILICAASNEIVISTFSELYKIPRIVLEPTILGSSCWSIERCNSFGKNPIKTKLITYH
jgi:hypothetical protein